MIGPAPDVPVNITNGGLVNDAGAVADAQAAISQAIALSTAGPDWKFQFTYSATTIGGDFGTWVNDRTEMRLGDAYVFGSASNKTWDSTRVLDPITGQRDPVLSATATTFKAGSVYPTFTALSVREARLIVAEAGLAAGDTTTFATQVNTLRAFDQLPAWNQGAPQVRADSLLWYERQDNLYLQGRRLADMYRTKGEYRALATLLTKGAAHAPDKATRLSRLREAADLHLKSSEPVSHLVEARNAGRSQDRSLVIAAVQWPSLGGGGGPPPPRACFTPENMAAATPTVTSPARLVRAGERRRTWSDRSCGPSKAKTPPLAKYRDPSRV